MSQQETRLALTQQVLNNAPTTKAILELAEVQQNWIATYEKISGKKDGAVRFEAEKIMFLQLTSANNAFRYVEKFSLYSAWIELAISGLTLRDGISYVIPYGKKASFMPGWKGRLEQITEMKDVIYVHEPQVVREGDVFDHELGENPRVIKHKPTGTGEIIWVYLIIDFTHGPRTYFMSRKQVTDIRDRRSKTYQSYLSDCKQYNQEIGASFTKPGNGYDINVEPPMWISDEDQAFKKTIVKRVYNTLPKLPKQKYLDDKIAEAKAAGLSDEADDEMDFDQFTNLPEGDDAGEPAATDPGTDEGETF